MDLHKKTCKVDKLKQLARESASVQSLVIANLSEQVNNYEENMPLSSIDLELYNKTKTDLEELQLKRTQALIFRSKVRWYELGERSTKYFYNLEKTRYNMKTCKKIFDPAKDNVLVSDETEIRRIQESFYTELYCKDDCVFNIVNEHNLGLNSQDKSDLNKPFTLLEISEAVRTMKNDKTPGDDGLPIEFYKIFWKELSGALPQPCGGGV